MYERYSAHRTFIYHKITGLRHCNGYLVLILILSYLDLKIYMNEEILIIFASLKLICEMQR